MLDLRDGPLVLTLPDLSDRFHVFQLIDAWMGDFGLIGTRTTQGRPGSWLIRGPHSTSAGPAGLHRLDSPTNQAFLLGRIRALDDTDATAAAARGRGARLEPLDPAALPLPAMAPPPGNAQSVGSDGIAFFDELGDALAVNAPVTHDQRAAIDRAAKLGVGPGRRPSAEQSGSSVAALGTAVTEGLHELAHPTNLGGHRVNGWDVNLHLGERRDTAGLVSRALIARYFWGPVPAAEAVYPRATVGSDGRPLDGSKRYRIHFKADHLPPVNGFWSVTVYGPDMFLVPNATNRYSLSGDTPGIVTARDGSIDLFLQRDEPTQHAANWLPVPDGSFNVIMRLYLPRAPILDGTYEYPPIEVLGTETR